MAIGLLIFAGLLEVYTFQVAWREIGGSAGFKAARANTTVLAVLLEDSVALLGIAVTLFVAFWSRVVEPAPRMDAIISIFIGFLLGTMAIALAKLNKEVLIDVADLGIHAEIERAIRERAGLDLKVVSSLMDAEHCLLFIHVAPETIPVNVDYKRLTAIGEEIKLHAAKMMGKTIKHVYWRFPPRSEGLTK